MMKKLANTEFHTTPEGEVMVVNFEGSFKYEPEHSDITSLIIDQLESFYPEAYKVLSEKYQRALPNRRYHQYLIVHRFIRCNLSNYDNIPDITSEGSFNFEFVPCPLRGECKLSKIVCYPKFNSKLSERELEVMKLYYKRVDQNKIAEQLFISVHTVHKHKRASLHKTGLHSVADFIAYAAKNNLFRE